jgi:hypothetical protein
MLNLLLSVQGRATAPSFGWSRPALFVVEVILFAVILGDLEQIAVAMGPAVSIVILIFVVVAT